MSDLPLASPSDSDEIEVFRGSPLVPLKKREASLKKTLDGILRQDQGARLYRVVNSLVSAAETGDMAAQKIIWDRLEGPVTSAVEGGISVRVVFDGTSGSPGNSSVLDASWTGRALEPEE